MLPVCLAEPLNHSNTFWNLVHICPTLLLEDVHPIGNASTWTSFQTGLNSDISNATVIGYGPFFPQSPTHPDVVEESVQYCRDVPSKLEQECTIIICDHAIYEVVLGLRKIKPVKCEKVDFEHECLLYWPEFPWSDWTFNAEHWNRGHNGWG